MEDFSDKVEQVLTWAGTDSTIIALQRKCFHRLVLEELKTETLAHLLVWKQPCCSGIFEGETRDRGSVIARSNTNTRSSCWIRTMLRVDGISGLHKFEQGLRDSLREQAEVFKNLFQGARQEGRSIDDVQTLRFNEFRKHILAQKASIFTGLADVRKEVQEVNAKVDIIASRVNGVEKNVEETKEALSHQLLEFQSQAQANHNILHAQLSELVNYINWGSADKNGDGSSCPLPTPVRVERRPLPTPQPPPDDQGSGQFLSAEQAAELVREADRRESDRLERERARERRERRLSGSDSYKRRRGQ
ncbi:pentatricopeptide repeat-containing protein [Dorcoceras hygrometricum]|uniref:Pentatricopeptide repeat-containing protein n=1 Tax=Dorcoceras hygrometricum TaxID=472368 RepID=A0A2Z7AVY0_9LAMI|nr:pentatricopeptide repeat-containing protein [Dorcoceras hygrometricum]